MTDPQEPLVERVRDRIHPGGCSCGKCVSDARAIIREVADAVRHEKSFMSYAGVEIDKYEIADWLESLAQAEGGGDHE